MCYVGEEVSQVQERYEKHVQTYNTNKKTTNGLQVIQKNSLNK